MSTPGQLPVSANVECKSPAITNPMEAALSQLLHYSNQRQLDYAEREGIPELFHFNALLVGTHFYEARASTLGDDGEFFAEWKDTHPIPASQALREVGRADGKLSSQEMLVAGMLRPAHLLDLIRISLERQLRATMELTGENVRPTAEEQRLNLPQIEIVQRILREEGPDLVFCMIQKNQDEDLEKEALTAEVPAYVRPDPPEGLSGGDGPEEPPPRGPKTRHYNSDADPVRRGLPAGTQPATRTLRVTVPKTTAKIEPLNQSERIILLIDECHRSQAGDFHTYMMAVLPNAARIGFTGTPIFRDGDKNTLRIFGRFLDIYGMTESWRDGATVEIVYEGRAADGLVEQTERLDEAFTNRFRHYTEAERDVIRQRYGNEPDILEAERLIEAKARDMMLHYAGEILAGGFKAQVVAVSRKAAVRYQEALVTAKGELLAAVESLPAETLALPPDDLVHESEWTQYLVRLHGHRDRLKELEVATVISGVHTDPLSWRQWTDPAAREKHEADFKKPFLHDQPEKRSPLGIIVVKNMLLTGFDAPVEQVLYLDRLMADHELLQAVARVNRRKAGKERGCVVDYAGVAEALAKAIQAVRELEEQNDPETTGPSGNAIVDLRDALPKLRAAHEAVRQVLLLLGVEAKVKQLVDAYIAAPGVDPVIPPTSVLNVKFADEVKKYGNSRTRASAMQHALRLHLAVKMAEDPSGYRKFSEKLEAILQNLKDRWDERIDALKSLLREMSELEAECPVEGIEPRVHGPFFGLLREECESAGQPPVDLGRVVSLTHELVEHVRQKICTVDFWQDPNSRRQLETWIYT